MPVQKNHLEALKKRIRKAFDDVPYPKGGIAPHECDECREVRETFSNRNWKTISAEVLEENHGIIPLFSPAAFQYFLPAYLMHSLDNFGENYDTVCEFTIYAIAPENKSIKMGLAYWQERFANFTAEQLSCIYEFLDLVRIDENFANFVKIAAAGRQNLREFIEPNLKK